MTLETMSTRLNPALTLSFENALKIKNKKNSTIQKKPQNKNNQNKTNTKRVH